MGEFYLKHNSETMEESVRRTVLGGYASIREAMHYNIYEEVIPEDYIIMEHVAEVGFIQVWPGLPPLELKTET